MALANNAIEHIALDSAIFSLKIAPVKSRSKRTPDTPGIGQFHLRVTSVGECRLRRRKISKAHCACTRSCVKACACTCMHVCVCVLLHVRVLHVCAHMRVHTVHGCVCLSAHATIASRPGIATHQWLAPKASRKITNLSSFNSITISSQFELCDSCHMLAWWS